jgi:predicted ATPase
MLTSFTVKRFKSLAEVEKVQLRPLTVLFGPNAAGKSNFLEALQLLSRLASEKTLAEAFTGPVRGLPLEAFTFPPEGMAGLMELESARLRLEADFTAEEMSFRYLAEVAIRPSSGALSLEEESLQRLNQRGEPWSEAAISREPGTDTLRIRRSGGSARPHQEKLGQGYTQLSDRRFSGQHYRTLDKVRRELSFWRAYALAPQVAMRAPQALQEVEDVGALGESLAPFLHRLKTEQPGAFAALLRALRTFIPSFEEVNVRLDSQRGLVDLEIRQGGQSFPSRLASERTLRALALTCIALNPYGGRLVAFEEPENGIPPRRLELLARMLHAMTTREDQPRQVIVTTHSPPLLATFLREARRAPEHVALYNVVREEHSTVLRPVDPHAPAFTDEGIAQELSAPTEDAVVEGLILRGLLDG